MQYLILDVLNTLYYHKNFIISVIVFALKEGTPGGLGLGVSTLLILNGTGQRGNQCANRFLRSYCGVPLQKASQIVTTNLISSIIMAYQSLDGSPLIFLTSLLTSSNFTRVSW